MVSARLELFRDPAVDDDALSLREKSLIFAVVRAGREGCGM